jgi:hypothetical protein
MRLLEGGSMRTVGVIVVLATLSAGAALPAHAENWVWVSADDGVSYDADSVFVDGVTGYIAYNSATDTDGDGTYTYAAIALDCNEWRYFVLGDVAPHSRQKIAPDWLMNPSRVRPLRKGTVSELTAKLLCPARSTFRTGSIE